MSIHQLGQVVRVFREERGLTQGELAEKLSPPTNRSVVAHLEQGRRIPEQDVLERLCLHLQIPRAYWQGFLDRDAVRIAEFEGALSELVGVPLTMADLDSATQATARTEIASLLDQDFTKDQTYDAFRSLLVYYGVTPIGRALFARYFDADSFRSIDAFRRAVASYQTDCIRLFSTFEDAYTKLASAPDLTIHLDALKRKDVASGLKGYQDQRFQRGPGDHLAPGEWTGAEGAGVFADLTPGLKAPACRDGLLGQAEVRA